MVPYKTQGIILNRYDFQDADKLFTVLTPDKGKIKVVGRGVKKSKSKLGAHLEPFSVVDLMIAPGRRMDIVTAAVSRRNFVNLKSAIHKIQYGWYCCELLDNLLKLERPDKDMFDLLESAFRFLDDGDDEQSVFMLNVFVWKALFFLGYTPELYHCLSCGRPLKPAQNFFHSLKGGVVCGFCIQDKLDKTIIMPVMPHSIKILRFAANNSLERVLRINFQQEVLYEFTCLTDMFLEQYLDKKLNTRCYL
ncbi:MAG: DNA repair protein RecO [Candidatus Doudnabacteria bacterium]|nr:DNA repair protein RecO [Candidatus Doudnabacteria bacterium]